MMPPMLTKSFGAAAVPQCANRSFRFCRVALSAVVMVVADGVKVILPFVHPVVVLTQLIVVLAPADVGPVAVATASSANGM